MIAYQSEPGAWSCHKCPSQKNPTKIEEHVREMAQVNSRAAEKVQLEPDDEGQARTDLDALDGSDGAHNPKVVGSNPTPATIGTLVGASRA